MEMIPALPGSLKTLLFPPLSNKAQNKGTQGVRAKYGVELPPFISIVRYPGRPVILGMDKKTFLRLLGISGLGGVETPVYGDCNRQRGGKQRSEGADKTKFISAAPDAMAWAPGSSDVP